MHRVLLSFLAIGFLLGLAGTARTQEEPRAIIEKAIKALGGEAQLSRPKAILTKVKGVLHDLDGNTFVADFLTQLPNQYKLVVTMRVPSKDLTTVEALNGDKAWVETPFEGQKADAETVAYMKTSAHIEYVASLLPLLQNKDFVLASSGETKVEGKAAASVKVSFKGRPDVHLFFEKSTGLLIKSEYRRKEAGSQQEAVHAEIFSDYREVNPARADEQALTAAKVPTDDKSLLEFLRKRTLADGERDKIKMLIRKLGDSSFQVREKAKDDLIALKETAAPFLGEALKDPDTEIATRAKECLEKIGKVPDDTLSSPVIRLLSLRKPAGTAEVLLAYLPSAPDETVAQEVRTALAAAALRDGKPDKVLVDALQDKHPLRRAAAAYALGRDGGTIKERPGQRLLLPGIKRPTKSVQFRDGKKVLEWELVEVQFFNKLDDSVFAKP
jgi:hypothetical protein